MELELELEQAIEREMAELEAASAGGYLSAGLPSLPPPPASLPELPGLEQGGASTRETLARMPRPLHASSGTPQKPAD